ncbi:hypothetical protein DL771_004385 [Monosporascus sp. 5C6A]|nr:hypothetical protein DL771_004385 [Monosporascus sp. 5C6A]
MTVPSPQQNPTKDAQAARKRRRRAPAGGAADDCFTCIKKNTKCDRRRPYCSQCLEIGNECSGYKTQLTWGVGVASRGKLRGLSLPVAKSPPVAPVAKKTTARSRASSAASSQWSEREGSPRSHRHGVEIRGTQMSASVPTTPFAPYHEFPRFTQAETHPAATQASWGSLPAYAGSLTAEPSRFQKMHNSMGHFPVMSEPMSSSVDSLNDVEYTMSPMAHPFQREEMPYVQNQGIMYEGYASHSSPGTQSPVSAIMIDQRSAPTSCPGLVYAPSEPSSSLSSHHGTFEAQMSHRIMASDSDTLSVPEIEPYSVSPPSTGGPYWAPSTSKGNDATPHAVEPPAAPPALPYEGHSIQVSPDLIARVPFFLDYYENIMCPSMVLIDGPDNPFRSILRLASSSRSLQHAICALSACNLRMKRKLSLGQHTRNSPLAEGGNSEQATETHSDDPSLTEEHQHRNIAVNLLNQQLNDPSKSYHDNVLATILILCHYRMVESGIAKFHTQFAGVKKILSMRSSAPYHASSDSSWMEAIFTYFDSISASINEREAQLNHSFFGVSTDSHLLPPGAENWVGCDRELFKTINKLGRLNLLSQHRPVQDVMATPTGRVGTPRSYSPLGSPLGHTFKQTAPSIGDFFSMPVQRFDGNGFVTQLDDEEILSSGFCSSPNYDDHRSSFWREWKDARTALQNWEFDPQRVAASLPGSPGPNVVRDLGSLSEAFRYAALLYTERLASPNVRPSDNNFRNLVSQVVYYATSLESGGSAEKFLLWPLFVAGSECVNELQQNIIRNKCRDIMSRSGYMNNLAALEVLERLWAGEFQHSQHEARFGLRRGPFSWTKCIGGPGVGVEWIMF